MNSIKESFLPFMPTETLATSVKLGVIHTVNLVALQIICYLSINAALNTWAKKSLAWVYEKRALSSPREIKSAIKTGLQNFFLKEFHSVDRPGAVSFKSPNLLYLPYILKIVAVQTLSFYGLIHAKKLVSCKLHTYLPSFILQNPHMLNLSIFLLFFYCLTQLVESESNKVHTGWRSWGILYWGLAYKLFNRFPQYFTSSATKHILWNTL